MEKESESNKIKVCTKCKIPKPSTKEFYFFKEKKTGKLRSACKQCEMIRTAKWAKENPEKRKITIAKSKKKNYHKNELKPERKAYKKKWYKENYDKEKTSAYGKQHYKKNKENILKYHKEYQRNNKEKIKTRRRKHYLANWEKLQAYRTKYREENYDKIRNSKPEKNKYYLLKINAERQSMFKM